LIIEAKPGGASNSIKTYALPWLSGQATYMQLASGADLFVTDQLSGCVVAIGGTQGSPRVVHANGNGLRLVSGTLGANSVFGAGPPVKRFDSVAFQGTRTPFVFGVRDAGTGLWRFYQNGDGCSLGNGGRGAMTCLLWP
jgi:hypothetical protein